MRNVVLITGGSGESLDNMRAREVFSVITRLESLEEHGNKTISDKGLLLEAISKLNGKLSFDIQADRIVAQYIPSAEAKKQLVDVTVNKKWDEGIIKKQQKSVRMTQGAIFRFPIENEEVTIDAFITDWSPFPVAAAIAVHKDHPAVSMVKKAEANYFTGLFVRHPLTGDIIPVFVADWVKPEFGTGAVIINPAHNLADFDFARKIGLPIRFGLIPNDVTADPSTWPKAPVIKVGHTTKTGRFDNLIPEEAVNKYFDELHEFGHADKFTDIGVGAYPIFELEISDMGDYVFDTKTGRLSSSIEENVSCFERVKLYPSPMLMELSSINLEEEITIVSQVGEIANSLLFARCLSYDLFEKIIIPQKVIQVQKVEGTKISEGVDEKVLHLAMLSQAPNNQPAVLKKQIIEQVERFIKNHLEIKNVYEGLVFEEREINLGQYIKIKEAIVGANYQKAFTDLYAVQKNIYKEINKGIVNMQAVKLYFTLAYVLLGDNYPESVIISDEWNNI